MGIAGSRKRFLTALLIVALLYAIFTLSIPSTHAQTCAPLIPPPISGSPAPAPASPGLLFINEVLSKPKAPWYCPTTYSVANAPWIELYNPQDQSFDLYTAHASIDTGPNTQPYYLPFGASIAAHGFLVLFPAMYANTLTAGTTLRLVISNVVIDQITIPALGLDQSYARVPDGANNWQITNTPTIDASNTSLQAQATPTSPSAPTSSSTNTRSPGGSSSYNGTTTEHSSTKIVSGVQPKWNKLQLPGTVTISNSTDTTTTSSQTSSPAISSSTASSSIDISHLILMALFGVALAVVLFWCWRLFSSP